MTPSWNSTTVTLAGEECCPHYTIPALLMLQNNSMPQIQRKFFGLTCTKPLPMTLTNSFFLQNFCLLRSPSFRAMGQECILFIIVNFLASQNIGCFLVRTLGFQVTSTFEHPLHKFLSHCRTVLMLDFCSQKSCMFVSLKMNWAYQQRCPISWDRFYFMVIFNTMQNIDLVVLHYSLHIQVAFSVFDGITCWFNL